MKSSVILLMIFFFCSCNSANYMIGKWKVEDISPIDPLGYDKLSPTEVKGMSKMENQYDYFILVMNEDSIMLLDQDNNPHQKLEYKLRKCDKKGICKYKMEEGFGLFKRSEVNNFFEFKGARYTLSKLN